MIDMQLLGGVLLAVVVLAGAAAGLTAAFLAATSLSRPRPVWLDQAPPGQNPPGGIRREAPSQPQPEPDDARTLVLL